MRKKSIRNEQLIVTKDSARILLVDDDPLFCKAMDRIARRNNLSLKVVHSISTLGGLSQLAGFDVAIVDYDLGDFNGVEIANYMNSFFKHTQVVLISSNNRLENESRPWTENVQGFVPKSRGLMRMLDVARGTVDVSPQTKEVRNA